MGEYIPGGGSYRTIFLNENRISTNRALISTIIHEIRHGFQYSSGLVRRLEYAGYGDASSKYSRTSYFMEADVLLGNTSW